MNTDSHDRSGAGGPGAGVAAAAAESAPPAGPPVERLREELRRRNLDGFIVPRADEHQGEYVPPHAERLRWLTGFEGSAGVAVVLADKAAVFVDGRYTLQVRDQIDTDVFAPCHITETPPGAWLAENAAGGARIGYDPWLHTPDGLERLARGAARAGAALTPVVENPVDAVWLDQPPPPPDPFTVHPLIYAGRTSAEKRAEVGKAIREAGAAAAVLTLPDSIAWLLNIRGNDVPHTPFPLAFGIVDDRGHVQLFAPPGKVTGSVAAHFEGGATVAGREDFAAALDALAGQAVMADPATAPVWVFDRLEAVGADIRRGTDPCQLPKACKNEVELAGAREAHVRDGVALSRFLAWLAEAAPSGRVTEIEAADCLEDLRRESNLLRDLSFDTISGAGPNGAIVHYRVSPETNRTLDPGSLYLVDSGAQYPDGTTDVTRTVAVGAPSAEMRRNYTLVLKGHIALATARFPEGTSGSQLDGFARRPLWEAGIDFDHGTGHGVGSYLSVHEGPQRISKLPNAVPLKPGMIVSNEPGYYKAGAYGIRIENLVAVRRDETPAERPMLCFETLTLAPLDRALIDTGLLDPAERGWVDAYHARVRQTIGPRLDGSAKDWLMTATAPLGEAGSPA